MPVYPFAYDWRQPLELVQAALAGFVDEVIDRTKLLQHYHDAGYGDPATFPGRVNLVAHSMGGLVVAGYVQTRGLAKVDKVATIAPSHAPDAPVNHATARHGRRGRAPLAG